MALKERQIQIMGVYLRLLEQLGRYPTRADLVQAGITRDMVRHHFGTLTQLQTAAAAESPEHFGNIIEHNLFTDQKAQEVEQLIKQYKRFVVTTAVAGCQLHERFYTGLKHYCQQNKALLLVLLAADAARKPHEDWNIDQRLLKEAIVCRELPLNSNIFISTIKLNAKQIDPITGLSRIGQRHGSFIYASPKQRLKTIPTSNVKIPRVLMTTGAITLPSYKATSYLHDKAAYVADHDHVIGAIVVEIEDQKYFHFRQLRAESNGAFIDLGVRYIQRRHHPVRAAGLVLGDLHAGETDPAAQRVWKEVIKIVQPKYIVLHDLFTGFSINPHDSDKDILRARFAMEEKLYLEPELQQVAKALDTYASPSRKVVVVESNHNEFLKRWLEASKFVKDPHNYKVGVELAHYMLQNKNPLQTAVERMGLKHPKQIRWLSRDEDFRIAGHECGAHGDKGANGAPGSLRSMEEAYGSSVSAHSHSVEILRNTWRVGTSTFLKLSYNVGPSSWTQTSCIIYSNGARQMINCIDGRWRVK